MLTALAIESANDPAAENVRRPLLTGCSSHSSALNAGSTNSRIEQITELRTHALRFVSLLGGTRVAWMLSLWRRCMRPSDHHAPASAAVDIAPSSSNSRPFFDLQKARMKIVCVNTKLIELTAHGCTPPMEKLEPLIRCHVLPRRSLPSLSIHSGLLRNYASAKAHHGNQKTG